MHDCSIHIFGYGGETMDDVRHAAEERAMQFEISGRSFLKKIRKLVGWNDDRPRMCYGEYIPSHQAIRFRLDDAQPVEIEAR